MNLDIVIVDDDPIVLFLHKTLIKKSQDSSPVHAFENPEEALYHLIGKKESTSFLILLDINMPVMNGWEFLEHLRKIKFSHKIFVAMVTSSINRSDKQKAADYPRIVSFLEKPLSKTAFLELFTKIKEDGNPSDAASSS